MRTTARAIVIKNDQLLVMDRNKFGLKYLSLIGGEKEIDESLEECLVRELHEETGISIINPRLVIIEDAGEMYGIQYIYLCDYQSGDPKLDPTSTEAKINKNGLNLYTPIWLPLNELQSSNLLPVELKETLINFIKDGFPKQPINLAVKI
jgi:ADP-ribose pyrophosphatase YjhB (NUDIX family)